MIAYFLRKYFLIWVVLVAGLVGLPILVAGMSWSDLLPKAIFWSGLLATGQLYREFEKKKLWPLYDNLRISKTALFGFTLFGITVLAFGLQFWLRWTNNG